MAQLALISVHNVPFFLFLEAAIGMPQQAQQKCSLTTCASHYVKPLDEPNTCSSPLGQSNPTCICHVWNNLMQPLVKTFSPSFLLWGEGGRFLPSSETVASTTVCNGSLFKIHGVGSYRNQLTRAWWTTGWTFLCRLWRWMALRWGEIHFRTAQNKEYALDCHVVFFKSVK